MSLLQQNIHFNPRFQSAVSRPPDVRLAWQSSQSQCAPTQSSPLRPMFNVPRPNLEQKQFQVGNVNLSNMGREVLICQIQVMLHIRLTLSSLLLHLQDYYSTFYLPGVIWMVSMYLYLWDVSQGVTFVQYVLTPMLTKPLPESLKGTRHHRFKFLGLNNVKMCTWSTTY